MPLQQYLCFIPVHWLSVLLSAPKRLGGAPPLSDPLPPETPNGMLRYVMCALSYICQCLQTLSLQHYFRYLAYVALALQRGVHFGTPLWGAPSDKSPTHIQIQGYTNSSSRCGGRNVVAVVVCYTVLGLSASRSTLKWLGRGSLLPHSPASPKHRM